MVSRSDQQGSTQSRTRHARLFKLPFCKDGKGVNIVPPESDPSLLPLQFNPLS